MCIKICYKCKRCLGAFLKQMEPCAEKKEVTDEQELYDHSRLTHITWFGPVPVAEYSEDGQALYPGWCACCRGDPKVPGIMPLPIPWYVVQRMEITESDPLAGGRRTTRFISQTTEETNERAAQAEVRKKAAEESRLKEELARKEMLTRPISKAERAEKLKKLLALPYY